MMRVFETLRREGWLVLSRSEDAGSYEMLVEELAASGAALSRAVEISSSNGGAVLRASRDLFDFHTDGVFWPVPPRWMCIEVLRADQGGALHVIDLRPLADALSLMGAVFFGNEHGGTIASAAADIDGDLILRYRRDYMLPVEETSEGGWTAAHDAFLRHTQANARRVGELQESQCLFLDNWKFAHCREAFKGDRIIHRKWFGGAPHR